MSTYNFLGLVNDVNRTLNEVELTESTFATAIGFYSTVKDAVNESIRGINYEQFEWPFNHVLQEEVLVVDQTRYSLPNDVKTVDLDSFRVKYDETLGSNTAKLKIISYEEYLSTYLDQEYNVTNGYKGVPDTVFRTPNMQFGIVPAPDKAYNIAYEYYRLPVDLDAATDIPTVPDAFRHVIRNGALYHAYMFRGDLDSAALSLKKYEDGIKNMRTIFINRYEQARSHVIQR